jgi:flagellar FliL protein
MAKEPEPAEELPAPKEEASSDAKAQGGGKSSLIPALITVLAVPLVMILTWEVYMMPGLRKLAKEQALAPAAPVAADAAGATASEPAETEGEKQTPPAASEDKKDKDKGKDAGATATYEIKDVVANLSGAMRSRYIKVSFTLEGKGADFSEMIRSNEPKVRDATLAVLSDLTIQDLEEPGVKNIIRNNILVSINTTLKTDAVEQLYFSEFVVQ